MCPLVSLFRKILPLKSAKVMKVAFLDAEIKVKVRLRPNRRPRCPTCGKVMRASLASVARRIRHLDAFGMKCFVVVRCRLGRCKTHGERQEDVPFASPRARSTKQFDRLVASLVQVADKAATSRMFDISWRTVESIVNRVVNEEFPKVNLDNLVAIGIDETSYKRGHRYLTVVMDLIAGKTVWLGEGKSKETLAMFFDELGEERAKTIEVVTMDMSDAYANVVSERLPSAEVVYDKFHVVQLLLKAIDEVRRDEMRGLPEREKKRLKGRRFELLSNPRYRDPEKVVLTRLVIAGNKRISRAYELRVSFEDLWDCKDEVEARGFLKRWTRSALLSRLKPLRRFAKSIRKRQDGILAYFSWWLTNAAVEGMNNKIKLIIHKAFGFRRVESLMAMIQLCCYGIELNWRVGNRQ